jgi:protein-tyrosine phosphatase
LEDKITCDSAGTIGQHHGNPPDPRMKKAALARNITTGGTARMANNEDFKNADLLLTMDHFNFSELSKLVPEPGLESKIKPFCDYIRSDVDEVPDPYYGGESGFENVLNLLEEGMLKSRQRTRRAIERKKIKIVRWKICPL